MAPKPHQAVVVVNASLLARLKQRHFHDYTPRALRLWLLVSVPGSLALAWALWAAPLWPVTAHVGVWVGIGFCGASSLLQVRIPRTHFYFGMADVFVFLMLALYGVPAAVLAATAESLVSVLIHSRRLSSHIASPATAALATTGAGWAFEWLSAQLLALGLTNSMATLVGMAMVAVPCFMAMSVPLLALMAAKSSQRLTLNGWLQQYGWHAGVFLLGALLAALLAINSRQFGPGVALTAAVVALAVALLARFTLRANDAQRAAEEARTAQAQHEADLSQKRFIAAFTHASIGMALVNDRGLIHQVNQAACRLVGQPAEALLGRPFSTLIHPSDVDLIEGRAPGAAQPGGESYSMELRCRSQSDHDVWISLHCGPFEDPAHGQRHGLIYQMHDITSRHLAERRLHHIAYHDGLTDLANRRCFYERLALDVARADTGQATLFAVIFVDLDHFKLVNDSLGHMAGNAMLREVAQRLSSVVRPQDLLARLGGDEFAVLLHGVGQADEAIAHAQRLLDAMAKPMQINGSELVTSASVGVTVNNLGLRSPDDILRDADLAMYVSKGAGRGRITLFDKRMHERIADKLQLEIDLRHAVGEGQLSVAYQPLFELAPYRISGFEALARWQHPERGNIEPDVFIALAEDSGHMPALTRWVLNQACGQLAQWQAEQPTMPPLHMHVNISGRDLGDKQVAAVVRQALAQHGVAPEQLTLEITETTLMSQLDTALSTLHELRQLGVKFSIDDFGTGYSSLSYLSTLPIDSLKIDRSFVCGLHSQANNVEIVRAVFNLGTTLGKTIVAEGIETLAQLDTLKQLGVRMGQGYWLARPQRADQISDLLRINAEQAAIDPAAMKNGPLGPVQMLH